MSGNSKAFLVGVAITVFGVAISMAFIESKLSSLMSVLMFGSLVVGAAVTAASAASQKFLLALSLSVPFTIAVVAANTIHYLLGYPNDTPGMYGAMVIAVSFLPLGLLITASGGLLGWLLTRAKHNNSLKSDVAKPRALG